MKFTWFNLMAWPDLPSDFRQKHRSVWVDVPNSLYDPVKGHQVYNDHLDLLEYADQLGFDGIGINEHHSNAYGLMPSPNLMAAALTRRTSSALERFPITVGHIRKMRSSFGIRRSRRDRRACR
jgi:hypothetical protein